MMVRKTKEVPGFSEAEAQPYFPTQDARHGAATAASIPATPHRRFLRRTSQGYTHTVPTYLCFLADLRLLRPPPPLPSSPLPPMNLAATPTTSNATPTLRTLAPTPTPTPYTTLQRRRCHRCSVSERQRQSVLYGVGVSVGVGVRSVGVSVGASVRSVGVAFDVVGVAAKFIGGSGEEGSGGGGLRSRRSARKQRPEASVFAGNGCSGSEPGSQEAAAVVWASRGTWCSGWRRLVTVLPYQGEILPSGCGPPGIQVKISDVYQRLLMADSQNRRLGWRYWFPASSLAAVDIW
ncbi:uncharacterized protein [Oryctolagus cuniculus]|uniref:uncharacterized protein n=1 Tax=Oryctolagus cuniculus TaxID=9986 RepID=UPI003878F7A8